MRKWFKHKSVQYLLFLALFFFLVLFSGSIYKWLNPGSAIFNCSTENYATFSNTDARIGLVFARTDAERSEGLMNVEEMADDAGMYFEFEEDTLSGFWMMNTLIPLDMIFINSFMEIVDINENAQPCGEGDCLSYIPIEKYRYVLEINGGLSEELGINIGDQVKIDSVTDCPEIEVEE